MRTEIDIDGNVTEHPDAPVTPMTTEQIKQALSDAIQLHLDTEAKANGYDSILSACSYAGYTNDFQAEAISFGTWRSAVWKKAYQIQADVVANLRPMPTWEEILLELPSLV